MNNRVDLPASPERTVPLWFAPDYLKEMCNEDPNTAIELLQLFLEDAEQSLIDLQKCSSVSDDRSFCAAAHTLKGSSRQFGALQLAEIVEIVETGASRREWSAVNEYLPSLQSMFALLGDEVRKQIRAIAKEKHTLSGSEADA